MMADTAAPDDRPRQHRRRHLLIGFAMAALLGGGGFAAVYSGVPLALWSRGAGGAEPLPDIAFVPLEQLVVSLGEGGPNRHLRFGATLEVERDQRAEVIRLMPRVLDVLNGYLRALETQELADPGTLVRLRAQMLRRIQIMTGEGRVRDLLVTEFVLN